MAENLQSRPVAASADQTENRLRLLIETGLLLARESSLDIIVQAALDAGLQLSGAQFGAFFYSNIGADGEPHQLYKLSGTAATTSGSFPFAPTTQEFSQIFPAGKTFRSPDITLGPSPTSFAGIPTLHLPIRSYLAVPVTSRSGEIIGALLCGHAEPAVFAPESESLVATIAAQAAVAIDNARLAENLVREIAIADSARAAQRETADRLTRVFEATTDGIALMDRTWHFTYFNRRAIDIVAHGANAHRNLVGLHYHDVFPDAPGSVFEHHYAEAMDGRSVEFTDFYAPLDVWAAIRVFPTDDGIAIFFQDVTQERRTQREGDETASRLRQALDAAQLGTWTWDRDTDMLDLDERGAQIFFTEPHKLISRSAMRNRIVAPEDRESTVDSLRESLESGTLYRAEYRVRDPHNPNAAVRWIVSSGVPAYAADGIRITGMTGTIQDITDRKSQEVALRQSEKLAATGRLAATIAHEINNPLEAVTNLIYLAKTDPGVPDEVQELLETADNELLRVSQIAQQTLGFYRDTTRPSEIDLNELLSGVINLFARKLIYARVSCSVDLQSNLRIFGLKGEIRQVFSNLLVNAIDASQSSAPGRTICIRARTCSSHGAHGVSVLITDQGSGIQAAIRSQLFSPFITTKPSLGTGLGLWVTRSIVEKHGGYVGYRTSTNVPSGTVFRVFLPLKIPSYDAFSTAQPNVLH